MENAVTLRHISDFITLAITEVQKRQQGGQVNAITQKALLDAIQKVVDAAERKGVAVEVSIVENGFFPSERLDIKITAKKQSQGEAK